MEGVRFLRSQYRSVRRARITHVASNCQNPRRAMWSTWGARMLKFRAEAEVTKSKLVPYRPVSIEIEVYQSRDGKRIGHTGRIAEVGDVPSDFGDDRPSADDLSSELRDIAEGFLRGEFKDVKEVKIARVQKSSVHGAFVYEVRGTTMAAPQPLHPRTLTYFECRIGISSDGKISD